MVLRSIFRPTIHNQRELRRYVATVAFAALALALSADVANQLTFFVDLGTCLRSWSITVIIATGISVPIASAIGQAHLELYFAKLEADQLSRIDPLTGLANRRALSLAAEEREPSMLILVIADIDRFKRVNDHYGHMAGDEVIKSIADMLRRRLGPLGTLARVGGEEFALLCSDASVEKVKAELSRLRSDVEQTPIEIDKQWLRATISAGIAYGEGVPFKQLYAAADKALYAAKARGRNRVVAYEEIGMTEDQSAA